MRAHPGPRPRWLRRGMAILTGLAATAVLGVFAGPAAAAPQPSITSVQRKLNQLTSQEDQVVQHYDQVSQELTSARQRVAMVSHEVAADNSRFQAARDQIAQIASLAYEDGSMTSAVAVLTSGNPQTILAQSAALTQLATYQSEQLQQFISMARQLAGAQQSLQRTEAGVAALKRQVASQKASLASLISQQQTLLANLTAAQAAAQASAQIGAGGTTASTYTYSGPTNTQAGEAVAFAFQVLNDHTPYVYGGTGPPGPNGGYDCSGLVQAAWAAAGVSIPRTTYAQWAALPHIPMSNIEPGDLIFFDAEGHVAIYVGGGMIIDAPQPGMYVEEVSLSSPWYATYLDGAARP